MYAVSLWFGGIVLFFVLMRLFSSDWTEVGQCLIGVLKPRWVSSLQRELNESDMMRLKVLGSAALAVYLTVVFHFKLGEWWRVWLESW